MWMLVVVGVDGTQPGGEAQAAFPVAPIIPQQGTRPVHPRYLLGWVGLLRVYPQPGRGIWQGREIGRTLWRVRALAGFAEMQRSLLHLLGRSSHCYSFGGCTTPPATGPDAHAPAGERAAQVALPRSGPDQDRGNPVTGDRG